MLTTTRVIAGTCLTGALALPVPLLAQQPVELTWLTYAQLTAEHASGKDGLAFGRDRVRVKAEATAGRFTGGGMLDFGAPDLSADPPGTFPNVVADLYVNYRPTDNHMLRIGQYKTPFGMDFNVPGHELDVTKRGMDLGLLFNRDVGVMISGRPTGPGFGYDFGVFNPTGRSLSTPYLASQVGEENAVVGRLRYGTASWHAEIAHGKTGAAGGPGTAAYEAVDIGFRYQADKWSVKAEVLDGDGVYGSPTRSERVSYVHGAYRLGPKVEIVARHYTGESDEVGATTHLDNTYLGTTVRVFDTPRMNGRLQANYVVAGADGTAYTGVSGYRDDILLLQLQVYAEK